LPRRFCSAGGRRVEALYDMVWESNRWKIGGGVSRDADDLV